MADKNIQMKQRNAANTAWDALYPKTKAANVIATSGNDLETELSQLSTIQTAGGTATAITLTGILLSNGYSKTFIVKTNNGGAATTINGINLYKPNTISSVKLTAGKAVTVWYSLADNCFFIKASGGEGSALASQVLTGVTFSNDDDAGIIGTMPENGALNSTIAAAGGSYTIPSGYTSGGTITAPSLAAVTSSGTVTNNNQILSGYKAISNGTLYTGTIASKAAQTYSPSTSAQSIAAGQYLSGIQTIAAITGTATAANVLSGYTFNSANGIGLTGTIGSKTAQTYTPSTSNQTIAAGQYLSGSQTIAGDAALIASNILSGANIFGVAGSAISLKYATGTYDSMNMYNGNNWTFYLPTQSFTVLAWCCRYFYVSHGNTLTGTFGPISAGGIRSVDGTMGASWGYANSSTSSIASLPWSTSAYAVRSSGMGNSDVRWQYFAVGY